MKRLLILSVALITLFNSCKKDDDDPSFTSAAGTWTYTTPDNKITVEFELKQDGSAWTATTSTIVVDGQSGKAEIISTEVNPPTIGSIRINANDTKLTYGYYILFSELTVSDDFKEIKGPHATYMWPNNKTNDLTDVTITRK